MSYSDLLKDPRWQRKRLEKMQEADFKCERCGSNQITLNVHHVKYRKGAKPWEYENRELECLCKDCHLGHHKNNPTLRPVTPETAHLEPWQRIFPPTYPGSPVPEDWDLSLPYFKDQESTYFYGTP